ncbi:MAG TPA: slipin family protein [Pyrinomonadaceae bacterium]|nr:slipin family protein [Pyrinomonadaceae bacterium]
MRPNHVGYLFRRNQLAQTLSPDIYKLFDFFSELEVIVLPTMPRLLTVSNQEVLTQDNIALRFSYIVEYKITNGEKFLSRFNSYGPFGPIPEAEQIIHSLSQVSLRNLIGTVESEKLNEARSELLSTIPEDLQKEMAEYGLEVSRLMLRDLTFPKNIQDLFAKQLESKIRARADLENARTAVASARALKNASELMRDDDNIRFVQLLETVTKIADKGKHTFVIGDLNGLSVGRKE